MVLSCDWVEEVNELEVELFMVPPSMLVVYPVLSHLSSKKSYFNGQFLSGLGTLGAESLLYSYVKFLLCQDFLLCCIVRN
jgi:hypothetical protein